MLFSKADYLDPAVIPGSPGSELVRQKSIVEKVIFSSGDGFCVFCARPATLPKGRSVFTAVGMVGELRENEQIVLSGTWTDNEKFGIQLKVTELSLPSLDGDGVRDFLVGGFIKGIGPKLGEEIYRKFGSKTAEVFEKNPSLLLSVKGVGQQKLQSIIDEWAKVAGKRHALVEFTRLGFHSGIIQAILRKWNNPAMAIQMVKKDPYLLAWEIHGVGFATADLAAMRLGFPKDCGSRFMAGFGFVLHEAATKEGHCYLEKEVLFRRGRKLLNDSDNDDMYEPFLMALENMGRIETRSSGNDVHVALTPVAVAERNLATNLHTLRSGLFPELKKFDELVSGFERTNRMLFHADQKEALRVACQNQIGIITGGPGTGKTTIIKGLLWLFNSYLPDAKIALCAPTGRAAKRMSESTGCPAMTIHRLLGYHPKGGFQHDAENPLPHDLVICDESSMLDVFLADHLVEAVRKDARIVFVGDVNQLPSVGAGAVLRDLISSELFPTVRLSRIYRQSEKSFIAYNARAILEGNFDELNLSNQTDDFYWMGITDQSLAVEVRQGLIKEKVLNCVGRCVEMGLKALDIQVLCPMYSGEVGVNALNTLLQDLFNPDGEEVYRGQERKFRRGDKVMQLRNNYDKDVFNGDQGTVLSGREEGGCIVHFDGREVEYESRDMNELTLAYAMTIHKAQGSEARVVVQVLSTSHYIMLSRSLLYTGVTRARERCVLVGELAAVRQAVGNNRVAHRNTYLRSLLLLLNSRQNGVSATGERGIAHFSERRLAC